MRIARIKYIATHFRHLITNQNNVATVKACALAYHNSLMRPALLFKKRHRSILFEKEKKRSVLGIALSVPPQNCSTLQNEIF